MAEAPAHDFDLVVVGSGPAGQKAAIQGAKLRRRVALVELAQPVLERALEPFPVSVGTLDALHLSSIEFLRTRGQSVELASYDDRLIAAARALKIAIFA